MSHSAAPVFNPAPLECVPRGGEDAVMALIEAASQCVREGCSGLQEAWAGGDLTQVRRVAHRLKGGAACIGLLALAAHCRDIEERACRGDSDGLGTLLTDLQALVQDSLVALEGWAENGGSGDSRH